MEAQGGRMAIFSAEGGLFSILAGRYSDGAPCIEVILKGHSGDQLCVDRVGRPSEKINSPTLTICLTVQPGVIADLAETKQFAERGLIARFLFSFPRSTVGYRKIPSPPVPETVSLMYKTCIKNVLNLPESKGTDGEIQPHTLRLSKVAQHVLIDFERKLEPRLIDDLAPLADWSNKLSGALVRIAGLFHLAEHATSQSPRVPDEISDETMERALLLGDYFLGHARIAYQILGGGRAREAKRILDLIKKKEIQSFLKRECWQALRGHLKKAKDLDAPLALLQEHGFIRSADQERGNRPGRPSKRFIVNPLGQNTQYPQKG